MFMRMSQSMVIHVKKNNKPSQWADKKILSGPVGYIGNRLCYLYLAYLRFE